MRYILLLLFAISHEIYPVTILDTGDGKRKKVVKVAESLIGTKYKSGGRQSNGFDCSGFTKYVYKNAVNITLPASSALQSEIGHKVSLKKSKTGDLVFFSADHDINHVGIIHKKKKNGVWMIHASSSRGVISEEITHSDYWKSRIVVIRSHF